MTASETMNGHSAADAMGQSFRDSRSLGEHGRQLYYDATALADELRGTAAELEHFVNDQMQRRPYRTLGVAAGIGYVLGGGLRSRFTAVLLSSASRVAVSLIARELGARLSSDAAVDSDDNHDRDPW